MHIKELLQTIINSDIRDSKQLILAISQNYPFTADELEECCDLLDWGEELFTGLSANTEMVLNKDLIIKYADFFNWSILGFNLEMRIKHQGQTHLMFSNKDIGRILKHLTLDVLNEWTVSDSWQYIFKRSEENLNFNASIFDLFNNGGYQMMLPFTNEFLLSHQDKFSHLMLVQNPHIDWDDELTNAFAPFNLSYKIHKINSFEQIAAFRENRLKEYEFSEIRWCVCADSKVFNWYVNASRLEVIEFIDFPVFHDQKYILCAPDINPIQISDCNHDWLTKYPMPIQKVLSEILLKEYDIEI